MINVNMRCSWKFVFISIGLFGHFLALAEVQNAGAINHEEFLSRQLPDENFAGIEWIFSSNRVKRSTRLLQINNEVDNDNFINNPKCQDYLKHLCGNTENSNDDLGLLECVQTFKSNEVSAIDDHCQHAIWKHIVNLTNNENIQRLTKNVCGGDIDELKCSTINKEPGSYLACLIEKRENVKEQKCSEYIQRLKWVAFSDFKIITPMVSDCHDDIDKFKCGRIQPNREISQGQMLACLQAHIEQLDVKCRKKIYKVSELQADNIKLDRQLYMACTQDHIRFCSNIRPGSGQVYKCLMQHKLDVAMTKQCQDQLSRREKLIASDYRVSKGLVKACKEDIKNNHCRKFVSDDKEIRLAQILLCLESVEKNSSKLNSECQREMLDHRRLLLEDYRLSPEIVDDCSRDISKFCNGLEPGGRTIHCLMDHAKSKKKGSRITTECRRALEILIKETDAGEDWRVDPILREACQPVVDSSCQDVRGGNARVIYCLIDRLGTDAMNEACETALIQIQYFVARDYKLDPQLYRACKMDAVQLCHGKSAWADDGMQMDPERGPLILPCLYRYASHPQKNVSLKSECSDEIRRIMRQRAVSVDLQPEVEEVCLNELAMYCYDKTGKGEEILCLQQNLKQLNDKCKEAVSNLTEDQAEHIELNSVIMIACRRVMVKYCEQVFKYSRDEGDMMECLIEHKNELDSHLEYKCKAAIEHFQLISLENYRFTYKFKEACRPYVNRYCQKATTKAKVIECLSGIIQDDIMKNEQPRILKNCRQQIKAQLYQQRENIRLDPILENACAVDIRKYCNNVEAGNSRVIECLALEKSKLSDACHRQLFKVRQQEFQDNSMEYLPMNSCRLMIRQYCSEVADKSKSLECLKRWKDELAFDPKCRSLLNHMADPNTGYKLNVGLEKECSRDINSYCSELTSNNRLDKDKMEEKVIRCLKIKFRQAKLTTKCERQMAIILRQAALNYHLNPLLTTLCSKEIDTICHADDEQPGKVEECLKMEFNKGNPEMREECRVEIANLIEEARADINVDPLLQKACLIDVNKYCSDVSQGNSRHFVCLQNAMNDAEKSLQPDCYKMLSTRIEMFENAAKISLPNTLPELYATVNRSPSREFFMIVALTVVGVIFIIGLFCGRITRRTMIMKNK
ncbi:hypothetical protein PV327_005438 [Microctonus hyperodae]|uniref:Golgi apparatus protein 1 n=1 Tax=Microctonus hyperodae TaxID=165561 RepID=A0AA39KZQ7_MICHY|nr:hypothetical protein PV327_005438 [Microctonus hyperodae]